MFYLPDPISAVALQEGWIFGVDPIYAQSPWVILLHTKIFIGALCFAILTWSFGFVSIATDGFKASAVVVSYTDAGNIKNGSKFAVARL